MKKINNLIIAICIISFLASCSLEDDVIFNTQDSDVTATGDEGDDIGTPDGKSNILIVKDSIIKSTKATGDEGDYIGTPDK